MQLLKVHVLCVVWAGMVTSPASGQVAWPETIHSVCFLTPTQSSPLQPLPHHFQNCEDQLGTARTWWLSVCHCPGTAASSCQQWIHHNWVPQSSSSCLPWLFFAEENETVVVLLVAEGMTDSMWFIGYKFCICFMPQKRTTSFSSLLSGAPTSTSSSSGHVWPETTALSKLSVCRALTAGPHIHKSSCCQLLCLLTTEPKVPLCCFVIKKLGWHCWQCRFTTISCPLPSPFRSPPLWSLHLTVETDRAGQLSGPCDLCDGALRVTGWWFSGRWLLKVNDIIS